MAGQDPKYKIGSGLLVLILALIVCGCAYYGPASPMVPGPPLSPRTPIPYFEKDLPGESLIMTPVSGSGEETQFFFRLASPSLEGAVPSGRRLYYYRPDGPGPFPAVVILPISRGDLFARSFATDLVARGFACLRFEHARSITRGAENNLQGVQERLKQYVIEVRQGLDWLEDHAEVDPERLGILGFSLGALMAGVVMEADPRIQAGVLILGGGDLPGILSTSREKSLTRFRQQVMAQKGEDAEVFLREARALLGPVDPLRYAGQLDPARILMINGWFDQVIRRPYVHAFWEAAGRPELVYLPAGHYTAALWIPYGRVKAAAHFQKILAASP